MQELILPFLGAIFTTLAGIVSAWLLGQTQSNRLEQTLRQAKEVIEVMERSTSLYEALSQKKLENNESAKRILAQCMEDIESEWLSAREETANLSERSLLRTASLTYRPPRGYIYALHIVYWISLLTAIYIASLRVFTRQFFYADFVAIGILLVFASAVFLISRGLTRRHTPSKDAV
ncbi:MAG: hypothetical protein AAGM36_19935 [Cyanobacteria bacterium J06597_1]